MSVEDTLAERGARYGDFTDHAAVCQRIKMAMIAGAARWTRLPDTHKQALEVIADKIARILTGDPNYADNWHDIQGYAKLVEDRLPKAPVTFHERVAEINRGIQLAMAARILGTACAECGYPTDAAGTHYATCSQLTAPEEYKAEAQVAFDEAAEMSEALARHVSAGQIPDPAYSHCPHCGSPEGYLHNPDCNTMRRGKSRLGKTLAEIQAAQAAQGEPAAAMDDDSPRMQAIGQNGNDGEHYDDPWAGAPDWAKHKAQDADGEWFFYSHEPVPKDVGVWARSYAAGDDCAFHKTDEPNPNWRDTLITRT